MTRKAFFLLVLLFFLPLFVFAANPLDGTNWRLTDWTISSIDPKDVPITIHFAGGKVSGSGGINSHGGLYETKADSSFSAGPISKTEMASPEPFMRTESAYFKLLDDARSYKIISEELLLYDKQGNELMSFERVGK